jgi:hypothetical protein
MKSEREESMKKKSMTMTILLSLALCAGAATAQNALTVITVSPDMSPFPSDWREDPTAVFVRIDNVSAQDIPRAIMRMVITGIRSGQVMETRSKEFSVPKNGSITLYANDKLFDAKSVNLRGKIESKMQASNRIPDDDYDICCDLLEQPSQQVLSTSCSQFSIRAASAPMLIAPTDGETIMLQYPIFQWMPSRTTNRIEARYSLTVRPLRDSQTPIQSMTSGTVTVFKKTGISQPNLQMTTDAIELEDGKSYVWQVQAFDRSQKPLGENDGRSEVFVFTYRSSESMHQKAPQDSLKH